MESLTYEYVFRQFTHILKYDFKRDIDQYKFEAWENAGRPHIVSLQKFLKKEKIPFILTGLSEEEVRLPHRKIIKRHGQAQSAGMILIYPETVHEIAMGVYRLYSGDGLNQSHYLFAYKQESIFLNLINNLAKFHQERLRHNGVIKVFGEHDIPIPDVSWGDVILPSELKQDIRNNVEGFINGEALYRRLNIPYKRGFLFAGPPGNGKTMLLKLIASAYQEFKFILFKNSGFSGSDQIDDVFKLAIDVAPCVLCFEDLDTLFDGGIMLSHFLNKLDGFEKAEGIMILATTNHPEKIDPALINRPSRFDRIWLLRNPDYQSRKEMLSSLFTSWIDSTLIDYLTKHTEGFSMVYLKELYVAASLAAVDAGKFIPGEEEILKVLEQLRKQFRASKNNFSMTDKEVGFVAG